MLKVNQLRKKFGKKILFDDLKLEIHGGEVFALIGPNGVGKTTLMRMILGWDKEYEGDIIYDPEKKIGYSPDIPEFPKILNGCEVLEYFMEVRGNPKKQRKSEAFMLLEKVGLDPQNPTKVKNYSKGMKQRLSVAQSLIGDPDILLLDEPSAGLDFWGQQKMQSIIYELKKEGKAILLNSHLLHDVEKVADRGYIFMNEKIGRHFMKDEFQETSLADMFIKTAEEARYESGY